MPTRGAEAAHRDAREPRNPLEREQAAFLGKLPALLERYEGQFVALYRGRVVGHGPSDEDLARRMYAKLGEVPFYIGKVARAPTVFEVPSPETPR